jgi:hypothetical protein
VSDFVSAFLKHTSIYESSTSFWKWSAYCSIAAVLRDNCYRRLGEVHVYPNIYVLLLAESATHRKGNPVNLCEKLVASVKNTKIISGRTSIQAVLDELSRGETDTKTGKVLKGGSALFSAPELSAGIVSDQEAVKILTDIYDFREEYTSRLRGAGSFKIHKVCFSMMAASNLELLKSVYDSGAIFGGLLGRTFLVKPNEFRDSKSLFNVVDVSDSFNSLKEKLREISRLNGEFQFTEMAIKEYDSWYHPFRKSYQNKPDKSGISGRIHISILKLSMILAANYTRELIVERKHIEEAIEEAMNLVPNYQTFIMAGGGSPVAEVGSIVLQELAEAEGHRLSRKEILRRHWQKFDSESLDKFITTVQQAGFIDTLPDNAEGIIYKMTQKCYDTLFKKEG